MRSLTVLVLLAATALAEDHAELRKLINGYRNAAERKACELVLPKRAPVVLANSALFVVRDESLLWADPVAGEIRVTRLRFSTPSKPTLQVATISREQFEALVGDLLLIRDATLRLRGGVAEDPEDHWMRGRSALRVELVTGATRVLLANALIAKGGSRPYHRLSRFGPSERAFLSHARMQRALAAWKFIDTELTLHSIRWLSAALDELSEQSLRLRRVHLELLTFLFESMSESLAEARRDEILGAANASRRILAHLNALPDSSLPRRAWLMAQLKQRYPDAHRARVIGQFEQFAAHAGSLTARIDLVRDYWRLTRKRAVAPVLLAIATREGNELGERTEAIKLLTVWKLTPDPGAIRLGLTELLADVSANLRVRWTVAAALGLLGDRRPNTKPEHWLADDVRPKRRDKMRAQISQALAKLR